MQELCQPDRCSSERWVLLGLRVRHVIMSVRLLPSMHQQCKRTCAFSWFATGFASVFSARLAILRLAMVVAERDKCAPDGDDALSCSSISLPLGLKDLRRLRGLQDKIPVSFRTCAAWVERTSSSRLDHLPRGSLPMRSPPCGPGFGVWPAAKAFKTDVAVSGVRSSCEREGAVSDVRDGYERGKERTK